MHVRICYIYNVVIVTYIHTYVVATAYVRTYVRMIIHAHVVCCKNFVNTFGNQLIHQGFSFHIPNHQFSVLVKICPISMCNLAMYVKCGML